MVTRAPVSSRPLRSPERWVISGLTLQAVGVVSAASYAWLRLRREGIGGHLTAATFRLAWHADVHNRTGLGVIAAGTILYALGSILMARPYVSRPAMLLVAVPLAAAVGMLALGVLALVVAILLAAMASDFEIPWFDGRPGATAGSNRRRKKGR